MVNSEAGVPRLPALPICGPVARDYAPLGSQDAHAANILKCKLLVPALWRAVGFQLARLTGHTVRRTLEAAFDVLLTVLGRMAAEKKLGASFVRRALALAYDLIWASWQERAAPCDVSFCCVDHSWQKKEGQPQRAEGQSADSVAFERTG